MPNEMECHIGTESSYYCLPFCDMFPHIIIQSECMHIMQKTHPETGCGNPALPRIFLASSTSSKTNVGHNSFTVGKP